MTPKKRKTFSDLLDDEERNGIQQKFILVNETPHYPISFVTDGHLHQIAELDTDIDHPLGTVYMTKGIDPDNDVRIIIPKGQKIKTSVDGFIFSKNKWNDMKNPFSEVSKEIQETSFPNTMRYLYSKISKIGGKKIFFKENKN